MGRKTLAFGRQKPERKDMTDSSKLLWAQYYGPMQAAAQSLNAAIVNAQNALGAALLRLDGLDPKEWALDMDTLTYVRRPPAPGE